MVDSESEKIVSVQVPNAHKSNKPNCKPKVSLSQEETEHLISLWSEEEVLFNCKDKDYFKTDP